MPGGYAVSTKASLKRKVALYVALTLSATLLLFAIVVVRHERSQMLSVAGSHVERLSEVITRSLRFAMLKNQPDYVHSVLQDVAREDGIDRIRVFNKEGVVIDSTVAAEIGLRLDRNAEGCSQCHQSERPLEGLPQAGRTRTFTTPEGRQMLASRR